MRSAPTRQPKAARQSCSAGRAGRLSAASNGPTVRSSACVWGRPTTTRESGRSTQIFVDSRAPWEELPDDGPPRYPEAPTLTHVAIGDHDGPEVAPSGPWRQAAPRCRAVLSRIRGRDARIGRHRLLPAGRNARRQASCRSSDPRPATRCAESPPWQPEHPCSPKQGQSATRRFASLHM